MAAMISPRVRELSACKLYTKKLSSRVTELQKELEETKMQNKLLNRLQVKQEMHLNHFQTKEHGLPEMIHRHNEEVRYLKERVKKIHDVNDMLRKKLNASEHRVTVLTERNKKLEGIIGQKHLLERDSLTVQLHVSRSELKNKDINLKELQRSCDLMEKNRAIEYRILALKNKSFSKELEELQEMSHKLQAKLREKEKDLEVLYIYAQKFGRNIPRHHNLVLASHHTQTELSFSSSREMICIPSSMATSSTQTCSAQTDIKRVLDVGDTVTNTQAKVVANTPPQSEKYHTLPQQGEAEQPMPPEVKEEQPMSPEVKEEQPLHQPIKAMTQPHSVLKQPSHPDFTPFPMPGGYSNPMTVGSSSKFPTDLPARSNNILSNKQEADLQSNAEDLRKKMLLNKLFNMDSEIKLPQHLPPATQPVLNSADAVTTSTATFSGAQSSVKPPDTAMPLQYSSYLGKLGGTPLTQGFSNLSALMQPVSESATATPPFTAGKPPPPHTTFTAAKPPTPHTTFTAAYKPPTTHTTFTAAKPPSTRTTFTASNPSTTYTTPTTQSTFTAAKHPTPNNFVEDKRKNELLARLMAIDEKEDKTKQKEAIKGDLQTIKSSKTATNSWPKPVENMHSGKPAYATDEDPFGKRITTSGMRRASLAKVAQSPPLLSDHSSSGHDVRRSKPRRETINKDKDYYWEKKVDASGSDGVIFKDILGQTESFRSGQVGQPGSKVFGLSGSSAVGMSSVIPMRTGQSNNNSNNNLTSSMPEPDDLEEIVL